MLMSAHKKDNVVIKPYLGDRILAWRKDIPLKGYELAEVLKISQGSLSDIENNKSLPSLNTLGLLHRRTNINIFWLMFEEGEMTQKN